MLRKIMHEGHLYAFIISPLEYESGYHFVTPPDFALQLGFLNHPAGTAIRPHVHQNLLREIVQYQEVLHIRKGVVRVDFYKEDQTYLESILLHEGDTIFLSDGGHGFEMLEDAEMIEIKQGPYAASGDKVRFTGIPSGQIKLRDDG